MPEKQFRILVADDDENILELVKIYMEAEGYLVLCAGDGQKTLDLIRKFRPHLLILDIMMPRVDGREVCRKLRESGDKTPIIILTALGDDYDKIHGLELGADDYVTKPFNPRELSARVKAVLRRLSNDVALSRLLIFPGLEIIPEQHQVLVNGMEITLTRTEMDLLCILAEQPNRVFTRENLMSTVWGYDYPEDLRTVDTHIKRLRKKLNQERRENQKGQEKQEDQEGQKKQDNKERQGHQERPGNIDNRDYQDNQDYQENQENRIAGWEIKTVWGVGYKFEVKG